MTTNISNLCANLPEVLNSIPFVEYLSHRYDDEYDELYFTAVSDKIVIEGTICFWDGQCSIQETNNPDAVGNFPWVRFSAELIKRGYITI